MATDPINMQDILKELNSIKERLPNGELHAMFKHMQDMKEDISEMKYTLLNPEHGVIVKINRNEEDVEELLQRVKDLEKDKIISIDENKKFQDEIQKSTDRSSSEIEDLSKQKENEILKV